MGLMCWISAKVKTDRNQNLGYDAEFHVWHVECGLSVTQNLGRLTSLIT